MVARRLSFSLLIPRNFGISPSTTVDMPGAFSPAGTGDIVGTTSGNLVGELELEELATEPDRLLLL